MTAVPYTITVIHCWSAPRSRSTALLYSFESRGDDTVALDEPLYRRWLQEKLHGSVDQGISRPYSDHLLQGIAPENDHNEWRWTREKQCFNERMYHAIATLIERHSIHEQSEGHRSSGIIFNKQMAKFAHLFDFDCNFETPSSSSASTKSNNDTHDESTKWKLKCQSLLQANTNIRVRHKHVLLIRDPLSVLGSWMGKSGDVHKNNVHVDEVGIVQLLDVYSKVLGGCMNSCGDSRTTSNNGSGAGVVVIDSDDLASRPIQSLQMLCEALDVDYRDSMLRWKRGEHECDGPWAKWWYQDVWESSGWDAAIEDRNGGSSSGINHPRTRRYQTVPLELMPILRMSLPAYTFLRTGTLSYQRRALASPPSGKLYEDPRNEHVLVYVGSSSSGGRILPRDMAGISPFDSSVQGGDATWEGIRVYNGRIFHLDQHLNRLFRSAKALGFENMHTRTDIIEAIFRVLAANGMRDGAHMRLTLTRGEKCTSSMNPRFNVYGTTLIILPEWKPTEGATTYDNTNGISLITAGCCRRSPPSALDNKIHHNNMIQNILPKIQANNAGAADAIMLDVEGFVAETNATNIFLVRYDSAGSDCHPLDLDGGDEPSGCNHAVLVTPSADHCLPGITRDTVLLLARELGIATEVRRVSLSEFYCADEVFTTGTMGELTPVTVIDGRVVREKGKRKGVVTDRLQRAYKDAVEKRLDWSTEIPPFC
ncbi:hypothetical protein HJC23_007451 [Cyclotella cryptica]|uniref:Branched-chain-amino-acid transaminase n=1 Tax=Cyclotella cryptica TaxID=29204 RepID=A0ABD3QJ63_9STRA|eukprot:CCRYP_005203-RA/>CCRYP_005203-RA protein AED:0.04 eAED:0.04 QI:65/1/1/1/1/1/4/2506/707